MNMFGLVLVALLAPAVVVHCAAIIRDLTSVGDFVSSCPYQRPATNCPLFASDLCEEDKHCSSSSVKTTKCCRWGCDMMCLAPVHYRKWCKVPVKVDLGIVFDTKGQPCPKSKRLSSSCPLKTRRTRLTKRGQCLTLPVKDMIKEVIDEMTVSKRETRVALGTIAKDSELLWKFSDNQNRTDVKRIIENVAPQKQSGSLSSALRLAKDMFNETNGGRTDAIKVLLVFTDADVDAKEEELMKTASNDLKDDGILVQIVGITSNMNLWQSVTIASKDIYVWDGQMIQDLLTELKKLEKQPCH